MTIVGGLRYRLIRDSTFRMIRDSLDQLGWFDAGRNHAPVTMRAKDIPPNEEIPPNTLALSDEDTASAEHEMGSNYSEHYWTFYVDFYAENEVIGMHMAYDLKDILEGRMPSIGRNAPNVKVYDYTQATPPHVFTVEIEDVTVDRAHDFPDPWLRYWYSCRFDLVDAYGDEIQ